MNIFEKLIGKVFGKLFDVNSKKQNGKNNSLDSYNGNHNSNNKITNNYNVDNDSINLRDQTEILITSMHNLFYSVEEIRDNFLGTYLVDPGAGSTNKYKAKWNFPEDPETPNNIKKDFIISLDEFKKNIDLYGHNYSDDIYKQLKSFESICINIIHPFSGYYEKFYKNPSKYNKARNEFLNTPLGELDKKAEYPIENDPWGNYCDGTIKYAYYINNEFNRIERLKEEINVNISKFIKSN